MREHKYKRDFFILIFWLESCRFGKYIINRAPNKKKKQRMEANVGKRVEEDEENKIK